MQEDIVMNLRRENEYFQKQLDMLRKEANNKIKAVSHSNSRERISPYRHPGLITSNNTSNGGYEPQQ